MMTSTYTLGNLGSVASLLAATLYEDMTELVIPSNLLLTKEVPEQRIGMSMTQ